MWVCAQILRRSRRLHHVAHPSRLDAARGELRTPGVVRCEHTVISPEVHPWARHHRAALRCTRRCGAFTRESAGPHPDALLTSTVCGLMSQGTGTDPVCTATLPAEFIQKFRPVEQREERAQFVHGEWSTIGKEQRMSR